MKRQTMFGLMGLVSLGAAGSAQAQESPAWAEWFSANVAVTSDYVFRGISQTLEEPAIQGGMDLEHPSGLYAGLWGSSVNFGEDLSAGPRAQVELDVYGGFAPSIPGVADLDLGVLYYLYPGTGGGRNYDFLELGLGAGRTVGPLETGVQLKYSPDFFAASGTGVYYGASLGVPVSFLTLGGSVGRQTIEHNDVFGTPDYTDWTVSAGVSWMGFGVAAAYVGNSLDGSECFGGSDLCEGRVVFTVSR